ncbi:MAG TPA: IS3 family transposase [Clostridiaceae bacterium]|nr:IS3 family transposase [Clostridiaceae bacterium]
MKEQSFYGNENKFSILNDLKIVLEKYMDYYNNRRIKNRLKLSPVQYRLKMGA